MYYCLIIVVPIIILTGLYYYKRSKKSAQETAMKVSTTVEREIDDDEVKLVSEPEANPPVYLRASHDLSKQCIHLLGDFTVKDKDGEDISGLFTPRLRSLLTILILSTEEHPNGVSGDEIVRLLWNGKNKYDARNNRNVSLSKLRNILKRVGQVTITNEGNYWKIIFGEDVLCDYSEIMTYYKMTDRLNNGPHFNTLLGLLCRGALLCRTDHHWLDRYKSTFSYQTIELLTAWLNGMDQTNNELRLKTAETLFQHDCINEEALRVQCQVLDIQGRDDLAQSSYETFRTNHSNLMGIPYHKTLREVLRKDNA